MFSLRRGCVSSKLDHSENFSFFLALPIPDLRTLKSACCTGEVFNCCKDYARSEVPLNFGDALCCLTLEDCQDVHRTGLSS